METEPAPLPPLHQAAFDAIEAGDYEAAAVAYRQALLEMPADAEAKAGLAQVELMARLQPLSAEDSEALRTLAANEPDNLAAQLGVADLDVSGGHVEDALNRVVSFIGRNFGRNERLPAYASWSSLTWWARPTPVWPRHAKDSPGSCSSAGPVPAAQAPLPGAHAPRLGITHVPVQLRSRRRPWGSERLAPDAPGLLRCWRRRVDPHRGGRRERGRQDQPRDAGLYSDEQAEAWQRITSFVHRHGAAEAKIGAQLAHAGRKASTYWPFAGQRGSVPESDGGWPTVGPSRLAFDGFAEPSAMTEAQIQDVISDFAAAATRAVDAGFDTVEIHGAHGYLLHQFQSPLINSRTDSWGGDEAGRNRLMLAVVDAVRSVIPESMPLLLRISATDWAPGGVDVQASVRLAAQAAEHGVDLIDVSSGGPWPTRRSGRVRATRRISPHASAGKRASPQAPWAC
ncbi:putative NADPH dehydrogenase C23G7.10c [Arthrobacter sp. Hiyo4]|nr:putative NADPH dehydrogenase C23G7.10c [Arthrobacter sp. Hiyo4]